MKRRPLNRKDLDNHVKKGCGLSDCKCSGVPIYFHSACHINSPTWTKYEGNGVLVIECAECREIITKIAVADPLLKIVNNSTIKEKK